MELFPYAPPELSPILDLVGVLSAGGLTAIQAEMKRSLKRYPQFQWRVVLAALPSEMSLPLFGFWLINACPLGAEETPKQRAWTVLLVVNTSTEQASVVSGYAAEPYISDEIWKNTLLEVSKFWKAENPALAIVRFLKMSRKQIGLTCIRYRVKPGKRRAL
jgi:hypothetical protein